MKVIVIGTGYVGTTFMVGVERIKQGELGLYGIPLADAIDIGIDEIEFIAAYDVDMNKIGRSVYEVAFNYHSRVPDSLKDVKVLKGVDLGGLIGMNIPSKGLDHDMSLQDCVETLVSEWERLRPDVIVNVCTTEPAKPLESLQELKRVICGDERRRLTATQVYAYAAALYASTSRPIAFVNAIPTPIAADPVFVELARDSRLVFFGDDGATGATPFTSDLLEHIAERRRLLKSIVQFNIGGNADFLALTDKRRNKAKERTKSRIVRDVMGYDVPHYIKPTGYVKPLGDKKFVAIHIEYVSFNGAIDEIVVNMRINDSPALAGMLVDLVRLGVIAVERGEYGTVYPVNAFYMKNPGSDDGEARAVSKILAYQLLLKWIGPSLNPEKLPPSVALILQQSKFGRGVRDSPRLLQ